VVGTTPAELLRIVNKTSRAGQGEGPGGARLWQPVGAGSGLQGEACLIGIGSYGVLAAAQVESDDVGWVSSSTSSRSCVSSSSVYGSPLSCRRRLCHHIPLDAVVDVGCGIATGRASVAVMVAPAGVGDVLAVIGAVWR
jgi:hypothetical protein